MIHLLLLWRMHTLFQRPLSYRTNCLYGSTIFHSIVHMHRYTHCVQYNTVLYFKDPLYMSPWQHHCSHAHIAPIPAGANFSFRCHYNSLYTVFKEHNVIFQRGHYEAHYLHGSIDHSYGVMHMHRYTHHNYKVY